MEERVGDLQPRAAHPVILRGGDAASGMADILHQFLSQNLDEFPRKVRQARKLDGDVYVQPAEDPEVRVKIAFSRDGIEVGDAGETTCVPGITADFLTTAHLTTGQESPLALFFSRRLRARFRPTQLLFLLRVLWFMQLPEAERKARRAVALALAVFLVSMAAVIWLALG